MFDLPDMRSLALPVACVCMVLAVPGSLTARDTDGSRLGAEEHALGETDVDSLSPPDDAADWRYVEIESDHTIVVTVEKRAAETELEVALTKATGDELETTSSTDERMALERSVAPGLYYVSVASDEAVDYEITIE